MTSLRFASTPFSSSSSVADRIAPTPSTACPPISSAAEAEQLLRAGILRTREDICFLRFHELARTHHPDHALIRRRRDEFDSYQALTPPRVLTSDGEALTGTHRCHDVPADALTGLPVSTGTVEGRARIVLDMSAADLQPGDILVTTYTDPSWSPCSSPSPASSPKSAA